MRLVYNDYGKEVKVGDEVTLRDGVKARVTHFAKPHKPASSGKVNVETIIEPTQTAEYYVGVIGAKWIEREDRGE